MSTHRVVNKDPITGQVEAGPKMGRTMAERMAGRANALFPPVIHYAVTDEEWAELKAECLAKAKEAKA
jgi:hypothetical protein